MSENLAEIGWQAVRRHPNFRLAAERNAAGVAALHDPLSPLARWLCNDMGRVAIFSRILFQHARSARVSVADLMAITRRRGTSSDGRVLQVVRRGESVGWIAVEPGAADWRERRILIQPPLIEVYRRRAIVEIEAASLLVPEITPAVTLAERDRFLFAWIARMARFDGAPPELRGPPTPSIRLFLQREAGLTILYDLIGRQAPGRARLLERAPLSRRALSERFRVSRTHVQRIMAEAAGAGWLTLPARNLIAFSGAMSEEAERHFALTFFAVATSARAAMADIAPRSPAARAARLAAKL